jgi:hypothetical protein
MKFLAFFSGSWSLTWEVAFAIFMDRERTLAMPAPLRLIKNYLMERGFGFAYQIYMTYEICMNGENVMTLTVEQLSRIVDVHSRAHITAERKLVETFVPLPPLPHLILAFRSEPPLSLLIPSMMDHFRSPLHSDFIALDAKEINRVTSPD